MANLALSAIENLPLHMGTCAGFVQFMRPWEPRWPSISKQDVTRSVEEQNRGLQADSECKTIEMLSETDLTFTTDF